MSGRSQKRLLYLLRASGRRAEPTELAGSAETCPGPLVPGNRQVLWIGRLLVGLDEVVGVSVLPGEFGRW